MSARIRSLSLIVALLALAAPLFAQARQSKYVIIVRADCPIASAERAFIEQVFLKKITHWGNDEVIRPVDLTATSPVRQRFTEEMLGKSVEAVTSYWQQRIFSGRDLPPPEMANDEELIQYVQQHRGAIGYVANGTALGGLRILTVE